VEERAEAAEGELKEVKVRLTIVEVELEVLRNGSGGPKDGKRGVSVKSSMAYIQLEEQNIWKNLPV
jgi:dynactin 1